MNRYAHAFKTVINEDSAGYIPTIPNTAGVGGSLGSAVSIGAQGNVSGTPGRDTYATGDARTPKSIFGGTQTRKGLRKKKKR